MRELDVRVDVRIRVAARASQAACDMLAPSVGRLLADNQPLVFELLDYSADPA